MRLAGTEAATGTARTTRPPQCALDIAVSHTNPTICRDFFASAVPIEVTLQRNLLQDFHGACNLGCNARGTDRVTHRIIGMNGGLAALVTDNDARPGLSLELLGQLPWTHVEGPVTENRAKNIVSDSATAFRAARQPRLAVYFPVFPVPTRCPR